MVGDEPHSCFSFSPPLFYFPTSFNTLSSPLIYFPFSHFVFIPSFSLSRSYYTWSFSCSRIFGLMDYHTCIIIHSPMYNPAQHLEWFCVSYFQTFILSNLCDTLPLSPLFDRDFSILSHSILSDLHFYLFILITNLVLKLWYALLTIDNVTSLSPNHRNSHMPPSSTLTFDIIIPKAKLEQTDKP